MFNSTPVEFHLHPFVYVHHHPTASFHTYRKQQHLQMHTHSENTDTDRFTSTRMRLYLLLCPLCSIASLCCPFSLFSLRFSVFYGCLLSFVFCYLVVSSEICLLSVLLLLLFPRLCLMFPLHIVLSLLSFLFAISPALSLSLFLCVKRSREYRMFRYLPHRYTRPCFRHWGQQLSFSYTSKHMSSNLVAGTEINLEAWPVELSTSTNKAFCAHKK